MTDIRIGKILVGSPTYKVLVGESTKVDKIVVGIPLTTVTIGPYADIDNIVGVDTTGKSNGDVLVYDSDTGNYTTTGNTKIDVDGRFYPTSAGDSEHSNILIRRSGTQGEPVILQQGEMAYSFLPDNATDGFGNGGDRLYIATGDNDVDGNSTQIDIIGGKYFTGLMQHEQGVLTANSAILTNENKSVDRLLADSATFTVVRADSAYFQDVILTASTITSDSADLRSTNGTKYATWSSLQDTFKAYANNEVAFFTGTKTIDGNIVSGLFVNNFLQVDGLSFLDSTSIDGDLNITGNLTVTGETTQISTTELLIQDKRIIVGRGSPNSEVASGAGIAVGDSATPIATITYTVEGDSSFWQFDPGIRAPIAKFDKLDIDVIDCGIYA